MDKAGRWREASHSRETWSTFTNDADALNQNAGILPLRKLRVRMTIIETVTLSKTGIFAACEAAPPSKPSRPTCDELVG
jgi:hypothetical protein